MHEIIHCIPDHAFHKFYQAMVQTTILSFELINFQLLELISCDYKF